MKQYCFGISMLVTVSFLSSCQQKETTMSLSYPETKKAVVRDTFFEQSVEDPFRWLEDDRSEETADWVRRQNQVTFGYLDRIPYRKDLKERLTKIWDYEKVGTPFVEGRYTYFYKNDGLQNQSCLLYTSPSPRDKRQSRMPSSA